MTRTLAMPTLAGLSMTLAACGSGGTNNVHDWNGATVAFAIKTSAITTETGSADGTSGDFSIGAMAGSFDETAGVITLDAGGTITVNAINDEAALFIAEPATGATSFGVVGLQTASANLPSGTATFNGLSNVHANDGTAVFELEGTAVIELDFDAGSGSVVLDNLDDTRIDLSLSSSNVTDVAQISLDTISVSNGTLSGNSASVTSTQFATGTTGNQSVDVQGSVFGADGGSVGGAFILDDTSTGALFIQGAFVGE